MRLERTLKWTTALALLAMSGALLPGCTAEGALNASIGTPTPPPPPPPPADTDGDGIPDADDKCPNEKEDGKAPDPKDGCPNLDEDGDGIPTPQDKCPTEPETMNGFEDEDGCPDEKPLVQVVGTRVQINQKIQFKKGSSAVEAESKPVLDAIAKVLTDNPGIQLVAVEGHASKEGNDALNRTLTQQRVDAVVKELITRGVAKERLLAQGFGAYCPLDEGTGEEALEKNRRVEFKILYRDGKATDEVGKRGCDAASAKGVEPKALPALKAPPETPKP